MRRRLPERIEDGLVRYAAGSAPSHAADATYGPGYVQGPNLTMEQKIGLFPELPPEERREVMDYVERHPHLREAFKEVLRLDHALRHGRVLTQDPPSDEALAYVAVMHDVDAERMPTILTKAVAEIERRVNADARLHARYQALLRRRSELEKESDLHAQLRRLVGQQPPGSNRSSLERPARGRPAREEERNDGESRGRMTGSRRLMTGKRAPDKPDVHTNRVRRFVTAAVTLAAVYALLFAAGRIMRPDDERIARFDPSELTLEGYDDVRGSVGARDLSFETMLYLEALSHLREAESSFLGLFPHFDTARLDAADALLRQVIATEPDESFLAREAAYLLGKTELARGNVAEARQVLERIAASGGRRSTDAARLLRELEE